MEDDTERLYGQNKDQYRKIHDNATAISAIRTELEALKVDLVGATGNNGLRGEFRTYKIESEKRDDSVLKALAEVQKQQGANLKWTIGLLLGVPAIFAMASQLLGG